MPAPARLGSKPTLADVAALAGVSPATASRVLNGTARVSGPARAGVEEAVARLAYVRQRARTVSHDHVSSLAAVVCEDGARLFADSFFSRILLGASQELPPGEVQLALLVIRGSADFLSVERYLARGHADGVLLISAHGRDPLTPALRALGVPTVLAGRPIGRPGPGTGDADGRFRDDSRHRENGRRADAFADAGRRGRVLETRRHATGGPGRPFPVGTGTQERGPDEGAGPLTADHCDLPFVDADNGGGAKAAVGHLFATGRRTIASIAGPPDMAVGVDRLAGYREAIAAAGLADSVAFGDFSQASGEHAMARLLERRPDLDAVFVASDLMALGALRTLRRAGRRVPDDVAVVGFDDAPLALHTDPRLTTVRQPVEEMGAAMTRHLLRRIHGDTDVPHHSVLATELVVRDST